MAAQATAQAAAAAVRVKKVEAATGAPAAHAGINIPPYLDAVNVYPLHPPAQSDAGAAKRLQDIRDAHVSLQRALQLVDASLRSSVDPLVPGYSAKLTAGLYQQLLQEYQTSLIARDGGNFTALPGQSLHLYWDELLCSIVSRCWWPYTLDRVFAAVAAGMPEALPPTDAGPLQTCTSVLPRPLLARLLTRAVNTVSALPRDILEAWVGAVQLKQELAAASQSTLEDGKRAALEQSLLQTSINVLHQLLHTRCEGVTPSVREMALLNDRLLSAAEELVEACSQARVFSSAAAGSKEQATFRSLFASVAAVDVPANAFLAKPDNQHAWARWQELSRRLRDIMSPAQPVVIAAPVQAGGAAPLGPPPGFASVRPASASSSSTAAPAPTKATHAAPGVLRAEFVNPLSAELERWFAARTLSPHELSQRETVLSQLQLLVRGVDPSLRVDVFGSAASRTAMKGSDMDVAIFTSTGKVLPPSKELMKTLAKALRRKPNIYTEILPILNARVPIIKFTDKHTKIAVDLSFGQVTTAYKTRLLRAYTAHDPRVAKLIAVVKYWANSRNLNDAASGSLNSFGFSLLVIQYLQMLSPPVLPSLQSQSEEIRNEERRAGLEDKLAPDVPQAAVHMDASANGSGASSGSSTAAAATAAAVATASDQMHSPWISRDNLRLMHPELAQFWSSPHESRMWMRDSAAAAANGSYSASSSSASSVPHPHSPPLGALFIGFLHFYSHLFDSVQMVVNIRAGGVCARSHWRGDHAFKSGASAGLAVADPFDPSDNVARAVKQPTWRLMQAEMAAAIEQLQKHKSYAFITGDEQKAAQQEQQRRENEQQRERDFPPPGQSAHASSSTGRDRPAQGPIRRTLWGPSSSSPASARQPAAQANHAGQPPPRPPHKPTA